MRSCPCLAPSHNLLILAQVYGFPCFQAFLLNLYPFLNDWTRDIHCFVSICPRTELLGLLLKPYFDSPWSIGGLLAVQVPKHRQRAAVVTSSLTSCPKVASNLLLRNRAMTRARLTVRCSCFNAMIPTDHYLKRRHRARLSRHIPRSDTRLDRSRYCFSISA